MNRHRIAVQSSEGTYSVVCGFGVFQNAAAEIAGLGPFSAIQVVSSPRVWRALGKTIEHGLRGAKSAPVHLMDDAESAKKLATAEQLCRALARSGAGRETLLVAVGGGVVGDLAGFVAATYLRGVALVHVPTTLVAQIDSSIGGKTGVNLPEGKNLIGAFYPPRLVLTDPDLLATLPGAEFRSGLAEVIKHAIIADRTMLAYLERNAGKVVRRDRAALEYLIPRNVRIKAQVVSRDERESGGREKLNFGHTFAHALESITKYRRYRHGEAVAWGMMAAALLGQRCGVTRAIDVSRIVTLVRRLGPLPPWPDVPVRQLVDAMRTDKKIRGGKLRFVLIPRLGHAQSYDSVPLHAVEQVLRAAPHLLAATGDVHG